MEGVSYEIIIMFLVTLGFGSFLIQHSAHTSSKTELLAKAETKKDY